MARPRTTCVPRNTQFVRCSSGVSGGKDGRRLFDGIAFTREWRFINEKLICFNQPAVPRDQIAGIQQDDITGHDFIAGNESDICRFSLTFDLDGNRRDQVFHRPRRVVFLPEAQQPARDDNREDDDSIDRLAEQGREQSGNDEDQE